MDWLSYMWTLASAVCLVFTIIHGLIWIRCRQKRIHFIFSLAAIGAVGSGIGELAMLQSETIAQYAFSLYWIHIPLFVLVVSLTWYVYFYLDNRHRLLPIAITALWTVLLIINLFSSPSIEFHSIDSLVHLSTNWGEAYVIADGVLNPLRHLGDFATALLILFLAKAGLYLWRDHQYRKTKLSISLLSFVLIAGIHTSLVDIGLVQTPYMISFWFLIIVAIMGYDLGTEVLRAGELAMSLSRSQSALYDSEENMRLASHAAKLFSWRWNVDDDNVWMSEYGCKLFRLSPLDTLNFKQFIHWLHIDDREHMKLMLQKISGCGGEFDHVCRLVLPGDTQGFYLFRARSEGTRETASAEVRGVTFDVSEREKSRMEAQNYLRDIAHMNRVSALGELAASMAHELNQPLAAILNNAQAGLRFLVNGPTAIDEIKEILKDIVQDDNRASMLLHRMRGLVKKGSSNYGLVDMLEIVQEVVQLLRSDAVIREVQLSCNFPKQIPLVYGDKIQLQQVILNLLLNAFDATMANCQNRKVLINLSLKEKSKVVVSVGDNGSGFSGVPPEKLFQPFYTSKSKGLGMGLSICKSIVAAHYGAISGKANAQAGAVFSFSIPLRERRESR